MERQHKSIICIFLIFILAAMVIEPAAAVTVSFVDDAYLKANDYTITDQAGTTIANWSGSSTVTLPEGRSYSVRYNPNGLFDLSKKSPGDFSSIGITMDFFKQYLAGLIVIGAIICMVVYWRPQ